MDRAGFGQGSKAIVLDSVHCLGNETSLSSCSTTVPNYDYHSEDAGVVCKPGGLCVMTVK